MAENKKIPVLTVWKNKVILKNIFLVNSPPSLSNDNNKNEGNEEILMVGRHPECDIRLEHPSVSRFHLRIHSLPSSFTLSLTDLNSVHGTFVSGKRLEPNVKTVLKEGDTLKIGASSRVYKLHWIPLHQAYDMDHPFVPPLDYPEPHEDEDEENIFKDESDPISRNEDMDVADSVSKPLESLAMCDSDEISAEENSKLAEKEDTKLVDSGFDGLESLFRDGGNEDTEVAPSMRNLNREAFQSEDGSEMESVLECLVPLFHGEIREWSRLESLQVDNDPLSFKYQDMQESMWNFWDEPPITQPSSPTVISVSVNDDDKKDVCSEPKSEEPQASSQMKYFEGDTVLQNSTTKKLELSAIITPDRNSAQSIRSSIGKQESYPQVPSDRENGKYAPVSRALFSGVDEEEEDHEIFTPDKENLTPNTHKSLRKFAVLNEVKYSNASKSSLSVVPESSDIVYANGISPVSDIQNISNENSVCFTGNKHEENWCKSKSQKWDIIVDTTTLLDKESRKALELLEGLKGTQLIIPRIVIRELDSLKGQTSFFRRNTEASSALEWVKERMIKARRWIHVQSCVDEGMSVAPTPPSSPLSQFSSPMFGSTPQILSPTAKDCVLEYALSFRKKTQDEHVALLSNDITLKINAMAEGLICEEAGDFRGSMVNPFSERFLWGHSSPRGQTWCCADDSVLKEKFYPSSLKRTPKAIENTKGLKLILLYYSNSQYLSA